MLRAYKMPPDRRELRRDPSAAQPLPHALAGKRVWVAGHRGMVGAALLRRLDREGCELLTAGRDAVDLRDQSATFAWIARERPQAIFLAAARVGGILANQSRPGDFLYDNLMIAANVIEGARRVGAEKLLLVGSSAVYPQHAPQPMAEDALLTGPPDPSHQGYATAKIAGLALAQTYRRQHGCDVICALPTNLYGPGVPFDLATGHVLPALIRKAHEAKVACERQLVVWGTGAPRREFLHVDDCADALVYLMQTYSDESPVNLGCGQDIAIGDLARLVCEVVGFEGELVFDTTKPDGVPRRLLDVGRLTALGWRASIPLREGVAGAYEWFRDATAVGGTA